MNLKALNGYSLKVFISSIILAVVALATISQFLYKKLLLKQDTED
jgi:hypothetical protein